MMTTTNDPLGQHLFVAAIALRGGDIADDYLCEEIAAEIGMTAADPPVSWKYPTNDNKGGVGVTTVLPITESFIAVDSWPMLGGRYLVVCSCREFDHDIVMRLCSAHGFQVMDSTIGHLTIGAK